MSATLRVLLPDGLGDEGLALLRAVPGLVVDLAPKLPPEELRARIAEAQALIVRSATKVTKELLACARKLQVVVRAGTGIDNIDLEAATAAGVVVMNTPGGNTNAAVEHTMALLLGLVRNVGQASRALAEGRWERERFEGVELSGRTLGVVGLGKIGSEVAARARAFGMEVVVHDPFVSRETAEARGFVSLSLDELLAAADVLTLHVPLADSTRHLIGAKELARLKQGARVVNCARGGLLDEKALLEALESGHLAGAALDVYEAEPSPAPELVRHPKVLATPHLGASTVEARASVGIQAARQVIGVLQGTSFENAINVPVRDASVLTRLKEWLKLAERLGSLQAQLLPGGVQEVGLEVAGGIEDLAPLRLAYLKGLLGKVEGAEVNYVNAPFLASARGIRTVETRAKARSDYSVLLTTRLRTDAGESTVRATVIADLGPRIVELDSIRIGVVPDGTLLICRSIDRPGVIGRIGTVLGEREINISEFRLGRAKPGGEALSIVTLERAPDAATLEALRAEPSIVSALLVQL